MQLIRARAPVRIDFAGGWTDVEPYSSQHGGYVVNAAISRYAHVTVAPSEEGAISLSSSDSGDELIAKDIRRLEYNGNLDLIKAALKNRPQAALGNKGFHLSIRSDAPPGSGVGTSSAAAVSTIAALHAYTDRFPTPSQLAEEAHNLEVSELKVSGGKQDQYASALGGINLLRFSKDLVETEQVNLPKEKLFELEERLILCYTGQSRLSGSVVKRVMDRYISGDEQVVSALHQLATIGKESARILLDGSIDEFGLLLSENWRMQKLLHPEVTTDRLEEVFDISSRCGAVGWKACGAGGGGCAIILESPWGDNSLRRSLETSGFDVLHYSFVDAGVKVWPDVSLRFLK